MSRGKLFLYPVFRMQYLYVFMFYAITVTQFTKMLQNLSKILAKAAVEAENRKVDFSVYLNSRLAPDQFNLIRQIQIACDTAKMCAVRLTGKEAPVHEDTEKTLGELQERIQKVVTFLAGFKEDDYKDSATIKVSQPRWEGKYLTGTEFAIQHAIPNMYFHIATAYSILRHNGITIGKKDYLGEMPYKT